jgi:hypothetical protein
VFDIIKNKEFDRIISLVLCLILKLLLGLDKLEAKVLGEN